MTTTKKQISCPECGHSMDVNELLYNQLEGQITKEYNSKFSALEKEKEKLSESIDTGVKEKLQTEKSSLEKKLRAEITGENSEAIKSLEEQLEQKSNEVKEQNKLKTELSKLKREKAELKEQIEAEAEENINKRLGEEKIKIRSQFEKENELKIAEKDKMIDKLKEQTKDMQRKLEQGSMQSQGEIQELAMEEYLRSNFPLDTIDEVKKGARGADSLHIVNTRTRQNCGSIYYESKRTKEFSDSWIEKFKEDMRIKNVTIGVIVTDAMPKGMERMGMRDGVWICNLQEFKGLCFVLREMVILYNNAIVSQENKGSKMELLYHYLCSSEFQREVEAIIDAFTQMNSDLISEQRSMAMIWKKRQKQIEKVAQSTIHMYGSIKGIAGDSIASIKALELPDAEDKVLAIEQAKTTE